MVSNKADRQLGNKTMSNFINIQAGNVTINTYRNPAAAVTTLENMLANATDADCLTASIGDFAALCGNSWVQTNATDFEASFIFEKLDYNTSLRFTVEFAADAVFNTDDLSNLDWDAAIENADITIV